MGTEIDPLVSTFNRSMILQARKMMTDFSGLGAQLIFNPAINLDPGKQDLFDTLLYLVSVPGFSIWFQLTKRLCLPLSFLPKCKPVQAVQTDIRHTTAEKQVQCQQELSVLQTKNMEDLMQFLPQCMKNLGPQLVGYQFPQIDQF